MKLKLDAGRLKAAPKPSSEGYALRAANLEYQLPPISSNQSPEAPPAEGRRTVERVRITFDPKRISDQATPSP